VHGNPKNKTDRQFQNMYKTTTLTLAALMLLAGCATRTPSLYYWGSYQPQVYGHFTKENSPEEQIGELEKGLEEARSEGKQVAPGYNAHLGLLYAERQNPDQMVKYFQTEKTLYPESSGYMDFLLRKFTTAQK
jgi:hypothetical protein